MKRKQRLSAADLKPWLLDGIALFACAVVIVAFALTPAGV